MNTYDHNQDPLTETHIDAKWVERSHAYSRKMGERLLVYASACCISDRDLQQFKFYVKYCLERKSMGMHYAK